MNEKEDDIFHIDEEEEYEILNDKIIKIVEEKYLKSFRKEVKIFQIIVAGYNASEQKDLQVFEKYGWNKYLLRGSRTIVSVYTFRRQITPNMQCWIRMVIKNDETCILESENSYNKYITISVSDDCDGELYNLIKQFNDETDCDGDIFGNNFLKLCIRHQPDSCWYHLDITCKI